ncbi:MAG: hypothetical protein UT08_C0005G0065 [Candidatus Woesebacteria bacterium GW2011_GWB1_38_8]|uniref:DUF304 domain-containing protein n=1 Tax=Candidatus Woesebacteria bacterium GW2011_GWB1_38_8 TaxID=1618570 RepID=A0A0G0NIB6_9BACT|nr:MAG: hypothetical protein UT08_C0005G0065 [Candidatus Woesebacteria bacterium GW2011_GWB1_38_8]
MPDIFDSNKNSLNLAKSDSEISKVIPLKNVRLDKIKSLKTPEDMDRHSLPGHTHNPLAAFGYYPDSVKFINEDPGEKIVLILRKHPITNLSWIGIAFLMFITPAFFSVLSPISVLPGEFQIVLALVWYLITSAFILEEFLSWFFHVNIVTDERIVEVDFINLLYREITDANIDQIQDVTVEVSGGPRTFFRFGDVIIQTAAQVPKITFEAVPNPDTVARVLRDLRIEEEQEKLEGRIR